MRRELPAIHPGPAMSMSGPLSIYEVGPRDGLQAEKRIVPTTVKVEFIERLAAAGLTTIEATSFVSPRWVPQLADADEVMNRIPRSTQMSYPVLVPNERGLARALTTKLDTIAVFASATETFARKNLNTTVDGALQRFTPVIKAARKHGLGVRGYISMCFGDPDEGEVPLSAVVSVAQRLLLDIGCHQICLGDTIGVGTAGHTRALLHALTSSGININQISMHFHDTYGQALANVVAALEEGVREFDSAAGGLGGCPYARSATGNLATEDLVWLLQGLGLDPGVDLDALVATSTWMARALGRPSPSRVVTALARTTPAT